MLSFGFICGAALVVELLVGAAAIMAVMGGGVKERGQNDY